MDKPTGYATVGMLFAIAKSMALRYGVTNIQDIQLDSQNTGIKFILTSGDTITVPFDASELPFNPGSSGINANNVQDAIYKVNDRSTYKFFPNSWTTSGITTKAFCDIVNADTNATKGMAYLGEVEWSDLPRSMVNAEVVVEVMDGTGGSDKTIHLILTSGNVAPYRWEYTYWNNGSNVSGWIGFQPELNIQNNYSSSQSDVYSSKYVNDNFVPMSFASRIYLVKNTTTTATLEDVKPTTSASNVLTTTTTNTSFDWSSPMITLTRTLAREISLNNTNSFAIDLYFNANRQTNLTFGAKIKVSTDNGVTWNYISSNQEFGTKQYINGLNSEDFVVYTDNLASPTTFEIGTLLAIEIFTKQDSSTSLTIDYYCGVTEGGADIYSFIEFNFANVNINTEQIKDGAITYQKLSGQLQGDIDKVENADSVPTENSNNLVLSGGVYNAIPQPMTDYEVQDIVWDTLYTTYSITVTATNGTYVGNAKAVDGKTAEIIVTADSGYSLPATVTVTNATGNWNQSTGKLEITAPTGNVSVTVVCA